MFYIIIQTECLGNACKIYSANKAWIDVLVYNREIQIIFAYFFLSLFKLFSFFIVIDKDNELVKNIQEKNPREFDHQFMRPSIYSISINDYTSHKDSHLTWRHCLYY